MATHTRILAYRIPRTEEPDELQSMRSQGVSHGGSHLAHMHAQAGLLTPWLLSPGVSPVKMVHSVARWTLQMK